MQAVKNIIKPIPTRYKNKIFSSKTEAVCACYLDMKDGTDTVMVNDSDIREYITHVYYEYEPEKDCFLDKYNYKPDFYIELTFKSINKLDIKKRFYIEAKAKLVNDTFYEQLRNRIIDSDEQFFLVVCDFLNEDPDYRPVIFDLLKNQKLPISHVLYRFFDNAELRLKAKYYRWEEV